jgi:hypothetical protein
VPSREGLRQLSVYNGKLVSSSCADNRMFIYVNDLNLNHSLLKNDYKMQILYKYAVDMLIIS